MLNEGIVFDDTKALMKSEMLRQLWHLRETTPDKWEQAVFKARTGHTRAQIDWGIEDNQAGYYTWIKAFDHLIRELVEDGYVVEKDTADGKKVLIATEVEPPLDFSRSGYPARA
ncbi:MAG: hypothetical protein AB1714_13535 [Acidobacteriota bacterium]